MSELDAYKQRLKDYLLSIFEPGEEGKPSMISLAAWIKNETIREIFNNIDKI